MLAMTHSGTISILIPIELHVHVLCFFHNSSMYAFRILFILLFNPTDFTFSLHLKCIQYKADLVAVLSTIAPLKDS